jgi:hypothetical protein
MRRRAAGRVATAAMGGATSLWRPTSAKGEKRRGDDDDVSVSSWRGPAGSGLVRGAVGGERTGVLAGRVGLKQGKSEGA